MSRFREVPIHTKQYLELDVLAGIEDSIRQAQRATGMDNILEQLYRARSLVWAQIDGYIGFGTFFYGRQDGMERPIVAEPQEEAVIPTMHLHLVDVSEG